MNFGNFSSYFGEIIIFIYGFIENIKNIKIIIINFICNKK